MARMNGGDLHRPLLGIGLRIGAMAAFALLAVIIKALAKTGLPEIELVFFRSVFGLIPVVLWILTYSGPGIIRTRHPRAHVVRAILGLTSMFCMFVGLARLPLNDATAIGFATPIFATVMSAMLLREKIGIHRALAVAAGFAGVIILTRAGSANLTGSGAIYMVIAAILGAAVSVTIRQISQTEHSVTITFYFMLAGILIPGAMLPFVWVTPALESWPLLIGLGLVGGTMQLLLSAALRYAPVSVVLPFDYTQIVFTGFLSWALWSELPTVRTIIGGTIIIASGLYILYRETVLKIPLPGAANTAEEG